MPETTPDATDEQVAPKSKFGGQMELDFTPQDSVGVTRADAAPPLKIEPVSWIDAQNFASAGGYRLVAMKNGSPTPSTPFDFTMLEEMKGLGWNVKLETPTQQVLDINDIKKLTGDDAMTWDKLMAPRATDLFLNLPPVAQPAPVQQEMKAVNKVDPDPVPAPVVPATDEAVEEDPKAPKKNAAPGPMDARESEEARETRMEAERQDALKKASQGTQKNDGMPKPMTDSDPEDNMSEAEKMAIAQARATFEKKGYMNTLMKANWNAANIDDELRKAMGESGEIKENRKYGLDFVLPNGHKIEWHENMGGAEFIGMTRNTKKFDLDDAHAVAAASKSRGWKAINAHGTVEQRDMIWLQAMRQGLEVANHTPLKSSEYYKQWAKEQKEQAEADEQLRAGAEEAPSSSGPENGMKKGMENGGPEMNPPAQVRPSQFVNPEAMATDKSAPAPVTDKDPIEQFRDFLDRKEKAAAGNPDEIARIQTLRDQLDGKQPAMKPVDPDIAEAAKKEGIAVPKIIDGAGDPNPPSAGTPKPEATDKPKTEAGNLTLEQYLDQEIKSDKNSSEVVTGLKEMKAALADNRLKKEDVDAIQFNRNMDNGGGVTRSQFETIADGIEKKLEGVKISRPAGGETAFVAEKPKGGRPTVILNSPAA